MNTTKGSKFLIVSLFVVVLAALIRIVDSDGIIYQPQTLNVKHLYDVLGEPDWKYLTKKKISATSFLDSEFIFVRLESQLVALSKISGEQIWETKSSMVNSLSPVAASPRIFLSESPNIISSIGYDGRRIWNKEPHPMPGSNASFRFADVNDIVVGDKHVFVGRRDWNITAYDLDTGEVAWNAEFPSRVDPHMYYDPQSDLLIFPGNESLYALDGASGEVMWIFNLQENIYWMVGRDGLVILEMPDPMENKTIIVAFNIFERRILWQSEPLMTNLIECITINNNTIYISGRGAAALSILDGEVIFDNPANDVSISYSCVAVYNEKLYYIVEKPDFFWYVKYLYEMSFAGEITNLVELEFLRFFRSSATTDISPISPLSDGNYLVVPYSEYGIFIYQK